MTFTDKIQIELAKKKITIKDMCNDLNISQQTYFNWKKGTQIPLLKAVDILRYLDISADEMFDLTSKNPTDTTKALQEIRYMKKVFNYILDSDDIKEIHELALGGIEYANKEHKKLLELE